MKILYTKNFKEKLSQPWSNISLGKVKLRGGTNTGLTRKTISKIIDTPDELLGSESTQRTYDSQIIELPGGGIQVYLDVPEEDQSFWEDYYQVIMFLYTDLLTNTESLAFVCYEKIKYMTPEGQEPNPDDKIEFINLGLKSRKNIITFPGFSWMCNISFSQSEVIKYIESQVGGLDVSSYLTGEGYPALDSWKTWLVDTMSETGSTPWIETTFINKYGIKIY